MNEEQGCFNPVIIAPVFGVGCALIVVVGAVLGLMLLILTTV